MKSITKNILHVALAVVVAFGFTACSDDDFTASIFNDTSDELDPNSYSYALDAYLRANFLEPYNVQYIYRMEDVGSDMQKNLVPATFEQAKQLAVLSKYLWYDVYKQLAGEKEVFLKKYSPRIIHLIGSPGYNTDGTETLGYATNGIKITLQAVNQLDPNVIEGREGLNFMFFHTMHHEFTHILDQTVLHQQAFNVISNGLYNADWPNKPDEIALTQGFITPYASANSTEDWAETVSNFITMNEQDWLDCMNVAQFDYDQIDTRNDQDLIDSVNALNARAVAHPDQINIDSVGYIFNLSSGESKWIRKSILRDGLDKPVPAADGSIQYLNTDGIDGMVVIYQKVALAREWLKENFQIDLDALREEVQRRQYLTDENGEFVMVVGKDGKESYVNRIMQEDPDHPGQTLLQTLLNEVDAYAVKNNE